MTTFFAKPHQLLCAIIAGAALTACNQTPTETSETTTTTTAEESTANLESIKIGSDLTYPPYEFLEEETPKGFDIELMDAIAKHAGLKADYTDTRFVNLMSGLDANKYDAVISALYMTEDRLKKYDMIPYFTTDEVVIVRTDSEYQPKGAADLCGKTIAAMKGTLLAEQLGEISSTTCEGQGEITIREFSTSPEATQAVLSKAVDAQYDDSALGHAAVDRLEGKITISSTESFFPIIGGIVIRKGDTETYELLSSNLQKLRDSGEYSTLLENYGLTGATEEDVADLKSKVE